jgi:MFS family permease
VYAQNPALFQERSRQAANSIYALATGTGGALAMIVGGQLIAASSAWRMSLPGSLSGLEEWRISFLAAAAPAPIMVLLIATIVLRRGSAKEATAVIPERAGKSEANGISLLSYYWLHPLTFLGFYLGIALQAMGFGAVTNWLVVICMRQFGETPAEVGAGIGLGSLIALPLGFLASLVISRIYSQRVGVVLPIRATRVSFMVSTLLLASLALATTALHVYVIAFLIMFTLISGSMFLPTAVQSLGPSHLRARLIAVQLVTSSIFAAISPPLVGLLSDQYKDVPNGLLLSALAIGVPCLVATVLAFYLCELGFEKTVAHAKRLNDEELQSAS